MIWFKLCITYQWKHYLFFKEVLYQILQNLEANFQLFSAECPIHSFIHHFILNLIFFWLWSTVWKINWLIRIGLILQYFLVNIFLLNFCLLLLYTFLFLDNIFYFGRSISNHRYIDINLLILLQIYPIKSTIWYLYLLFNYVIFNLFFIWNSLLQLFYLWIFYFLTAWRIAILLFIVFLL